MNLLYKILNYKNKGIYSRNLNEKYILKGGGRKYIKELNDIIKKNIKFREIYSEGKKKLILNKNKNECVVIYINEKENMAELRSLTIENGKCIDLEDFGLKTTGKCHLKVAIKNVEEL